MAALAIRRYEPGDADAVWDLHERALRDVGAYDDEYAHLDADLRDVRAEYLDAGGAFLVGELTGDDSPPDDRGDVVAMGALQQASAVEFHEGSDETGVVRRMRVDPDHQRQGYGTQILEALEARADDLGFGRLVLDTTPKQAAAMALYEGFGYEESHRETTPAGEMIFYEKEC